MKPQHLMTFVCVNGERYVLEFNEGKPCEKLFARLRRRADKATKGRASCAHGALTLRRAPL